MRTSLPLRRRVKQIMRQKDHRGPGSMSSRGGSNFGVYLLLIGVAIVFASLLRSPNSTEKAPAVGSNKEPPPPTFTEKRQSALAELKNRDRNELRLKRARAVCLEAVERDSGHRRRSVWLVGDQFGDHQTFFFTADEPANNRLFMSYDYICDGSSGRAEITQRKVDVGVKRVDRR